MCVFCCCSTAWLISLVFCLHAIPKISFFYFHYFVYLIFFFGFFIFYFIFVVILSDGSRKKKIIIIRNIILILIIRVTFYFLIKQKKTISLNIQCHYSKYRHLSPLYIYIHTSLKSIEGGCSAQALTHPHTPSDLEEIKKNVWSSW